jgi:hypothetical protein
MSTRASILFAALALGLFGCPKKTTAPTDPIAGDDTEEETASGPTCETAADNATAVMVREEEMEGGDPSDLRATVVRLCTEDAWPEALIACLTTGTESDQLEECAKQNLSPEAYERAGEAIEQAMEGNHSPEG